MTAPALRPYQHELIQGVRSSLRKPGVRRTVLQSPTGSGKTVLTAHMIREAAKKGLRTWFVVHRKELLDQTSRALWFSGVPHGQVAGGRSRSRQPVQVATIQTLARRVHKMDPPDLLVIDEAHHTAAQTYRSVVDTCPETWIIGLTATPERADGAGLDHLFDDLVEGPSVSWLINQGYLAPYTVMAPPSDLDLTGVRSRAGDWAKGELEERVTDQKIVGDAVEHYVKHVHPRTCLVYCVSRAHARRVEEVYRAAGVDARYCAGDTPKDERERLVSGFRQGTPPVLVSVDLFGEGLDAPGLQAVQLLRPTQSLVLHLQQIGRSLRPEPGKSRALVLDHVGNTLRHGLPDDERAWSLVGTGRAEAGESGPQLRVCRGFGCHAVFRAGVPRCPACGWEVPTTPPKERSPEQVEGELEELDPEEHRRRREKRRRRGWEESQAESLEDWVALAMERGYKPGWAGVRHAIRQGFDPKSREARAFTKKAKELVKEMAHA